MELGCRLGFADLQREKPVLYQISLDLSPSYSAHILVWGVYLVFILFETATAPEMNTLQVLHQSVLFGLNTIMNWVIRTDAKTQYSQGYTKSNFQWTPEFCCWTMGTKKRMNWSSEFGGDSGVDGCIFSPSFLNQKYPPIEINGWFKGSLWSHSLSTCDNFKPQL
jgi:hypothetical protein